MEETAENSEYERKLSEKHERHKKAEQLYNEALEIETTQPSQAVKLLYQAYELSYKPAITYLCYSTTPSGPSTETPTLDGTPEDFFFRGLQALAGIGRARNSESALQYFQLAAEGNHAPAINLLGEIHADGIVVKQNFIEAAKWFLSAAQLGYVIAEFNLGEIHTHTEWDKHDYNEAEKWFRIAAEHGHEDAQYNLAVLYADGLGIPQNSTEAIKWLLLTAQQGDPNAQGRLAVAYENGCGIEKDPIRANMWLQRAAAQGSPHAQFIRGELCLDTHNCIEAAKWFQLAANQNHAGAQHRVGQMLYRGIGGFHQDFIEATKYFRLAAKQRHVGAQSDLGGMYHKGSGVTQSFVKALKWFLRAAHHGHLIAQYNAGLMYFHGQGVKKDYDEAAKWFRLAARRGHKKAQENLKLCYETYLISLRVEDAADYRRDFQTFGIEKACLFLTGVKNSTQDFPAHYHFEMMKNNKANIQQFCETHPCAFLEELRKDFLLALDQYNYWMTYLLEYLTKKCLHGAIPKDTAASLLKALYGFPHEDASCGKALQLLWHTSQLVDKNGYLTQHCLRKYLEKAPEDKDASQYLKNVEFDELTLKYCNAEITLSDMEFNDWLKSNIQLLESSEFPLLLSECNLLSEFRFRLATIAYEKALVLKSAQEESFWLTSVRSLWSSPEPIDITDVIHLLKKIPPEHIRFEEANTLLKECYLRFKDSYQAAAHHPLSTHVLKK